MKRFAYLLVLIFICKFSFGQCTYSKLDEDEIQLWLKKTTEEATFFTGLGLSYTYTVSFDNCKWIIEERLGKGKATNYTIKVDQMEVGDNVKVMASEKEDKPNFYIVFSKSIVVAQKEGSTKQKPKKFFLYFNSLKKRNIPNYETLKTEMLANLQQFACFCD